MPRKPIDYSNTHIYKIVCKDLSITECYVGHTTDFKSRRSKHKTQADSVDQASKTYNIPVYKFIRENGGFVNFDMILISTHAFDNSLEARRQERLCIEELNPKLNLKIPGRTNKEYYEDNKDIILSKMKETYIQVDKGEYACKNKTYYNDHKPQIALNGHARYIQNKDAILLRNQKYYEAHKDIIAAQAKERYQRNKNDKMKPFGFIQI
jgi:hypothetical protein